LIQKDTLLYLDLYIAGDLAFTVFDIKETESEVESTPANTEYKQNRLQLTLSTSGTGQYKNKANPIPLILSTSGI
jgi:hypothetical protein